jgi:hypothetical protein
MSLRQKDHSVYLTVGSISPSRTRRPKQPSNISTQAICSHILTFPTRQPRNLSISKICSAQRTYPCGGIDRSVTLLHIPVKGAVSWRPNIILTGSVRLPYLELLEAVNSILETYQKVSLYFLNRSVHQGKLLYVAKGPNMRRRDRK